MLSGCHLCDNAISHDWKLSSSSSSSIELFNANHESHSRDTGYHCGKLADNGIKQEWPCIVQIWLSCIEKRVPAGISKIVATARLASMSPAHDHESQKVGQVWHEKSKHYDCERRFKDLLTFREYDQVKQEDTQVLEEAPDAHDFKVRIDVVVVIWNLGLA